MSDRRIHGKRKFESRDSSVGKRRAFGSAAVVWFPGGARNFSLLHGVQTGYGAHPASYPFGTGDPFSGGKAAGA
jgi:hypothetical protein